MYQIDKAVNNVKMFNVRKTFPLAPLSSPLFLPNSPDIVGADHPGAEGSHWTWLKAQPHHQEADESVTGTEGRRAEDAAEGERVNSMGLVTSITEAPI